MRKVLISVALATATLAAVPAAAQYRDSGYGSAQRSDHRADWDRRGPSRQAIFQLIQRIDQVENRIERSARRGIISPREALGLRRQANRIENRLRRSGRDGLSGREFADLRGQVHHLEQRLRHERRDVDGRRG